MKEFFYNILCDLDKLSGIKQFDKLNQHPDAMSEINKLLDILCRVTDQFPYIPQDAQKGIIEHGVVNDQEFIGLNAKIISKCLNASKEKYFHESAHMKSEVKDWTPVSEEKRAEYLKQWAEEVAKVGKPVATKEERVRQKQIIIMGTERKGPLNYTPPSQEYVDDLQKRMRSNRELYLRETNPGMSEEEIQKRLDA